jgi:quercetin dioxygenase-like cupin family protein/uncharacterized cupin superfamily protein
VRRTRLIALVATATLVSAGCGGTAAPSPAASATATSASEAESRTADNLGDGKISSLPKGTLYVQYLEIPQAAGGSLTHAHIAGFVYAIEGTHRLAIEGGETKDLTPSEPGLFPKADRQSAFVPADTAHTHSNPGTTANRWYFISIRPNTARTAAPTFPGQKEVFATADLPQFPDGAYIERLIFQTIQPNGRTSAHKHGGIETILVLDGSVEVHVQGAPIRTLGKAEGTFIQAETPMQIWNKGGATAKFLAFFVTANDKEYQTNLDTPP